MTGLDLANAGRRRGAPRRAGATEIAARRERLRDERDKKRAGGGARRRCAPRDRCAAITTSRRRRTSNLHVLLDYDLDEIFRYINPVMLYTRHLGFKGRFERGARGAAIAKALELRDQVAGGRGGDAAADRHPAQARSTSSSAPPRDGDTLQSLHARRRAQSSSRSTSARQTGRRGALPDRLRRCPSSGPPGLRVPVRDDGRTGSARPGRRVEGRGRLPALAHPAGAGARGGGGVCRAPAPEDPRDVGLSRPARNEPRQDLFKARYRGIRVSFGYPACPRLEDQAATLPRSRGRPRRSASSSPRAT